MGRPKLLPEADFTELPRLDALRDMSKFPVTYMNWTSAAKLLMLPE